MVIESLPPGSSAQNKKLVLQYQTHFRLILFVNSFRRLSSRLLENSGLVFDFSSHTPSIPLPFESLKALKHSQLCTFSGHKMNGNGWATIRSPNSSNMPFRVQTISTMKSKTDTDLMEQQFTTTTTVNPTKGSRVRITLDNGQYFVLRMPENYDGLFHEITSNSKFRLLAKFEGKPDEAGAAPAAPPPAITYESALAKGNAIVLCYSLVHSIVRRNYSVPSSVFLSLPVGSVDFYLCCGAMSVLYLIYLMARSRSSGGGARVRLIETGTGSGRVGRRS